jgi:hypothetical protein
MGPLNATRGTCCHPKSGTPSLKIDSPHSNTGMVYKELIDGQKCLLKGDISFGARYLNSDLFLF